MLTQGSYQIISLEISSDDKIILRKQIKLNEQNIISIILQAKRDKNYAELQVKLRKIVHQIKSHEKNLIFNQLSKQERRTSDNLSKRLYSQKSQPTSIQSSLRGSPEKKELLQENSSEEIKKKIIHFNLSELQQKISSQVNKKAVFLHRNQKLTISSKSFLKENSSASNSILTLSKNVYCPSALEEINNHKITSLSSSSSSSSSKNMLQPSSTTERNLSKQPRIQNENHPNTNNNGSSSKHSLQNAQLSYSWSIKELLKTKFKKKHQNRDVNEDQRIYQPVKDKCQIKCKLKLFPDEQQDTRRKQYQHHLKSYQEDVAARQTNADSLQKKKLSQIIRQDCKTQEEEFGQFYKRIQDIISG